MTDPLANLPRLPDTALGPCAGCGKVMLATGLPVFYRVRVQQCGIDAKAVQRHVGLAMMLGGGETGLGLASVMGPGEKPVVVMQEAEANLCHACVDNAHVVMAVLAQNESEEG